MMTHLLDLDYYRRVNSDLANFSDEQATQHFFDFGLREGRDFSPVVDLDLYKAANPDLVAVGFTENRQFFDHLSRHGVAEGRLFSHSFNTEFYRASYSDLVAVGFDNKQLFEHFLQFGIDEGRVASNMFDIGFYLNSHADLIAAGFNNRQGLNHFSQFGIKERRITSTQFDVGTYLSFHPDLIQVGLTSSQAFDHYQVFGINERRIAAPLLPIPSDPGNTIETSFDFGAIVGNRRFSNSFDRDNAGDLYQFTLFRPSAIRLDFLQTPPSSLRFTFIGLFADFNGNVGESLAISNVGFNIDNRPISGVLSPGTYWIATGVNASEGSLLADYETNLLVSPVAGLSPDGVGNSLSAALDLGTLTIAQTIDDGIGLLDNTDVYRFTLDTPANFEAVLDGVRGNVILELIEDRNNNGQVDTGSPVRDVTEIIETANNELGVALDSGTYFLRLRYDRTDEDYSLNLSPQASRLPPDGAGNTLTTALDLGVLNTERSFSDTISDGDGIDLYKFEVNTPTNVGIVLDLFAASSALAIGRDSDGGLTPTSLFEGRDLLQSGGSLPAPGQTAWSLYLTPDTYFVQVSNFRPGVPQDRAPYNLSITPTPGPDLPPDTAGNTQDTARNFDVLTGMQTVNDSVGSADFFDYYRFVIDRPSQVDVLLETTTQTSGLRVEIFSDFNTDEILAPGRFFQNISIDFPNLSAEESILLEPDIYFIRVSRFPTGNFFENVNYDLSLSVI
ncbi:MAG: hypothetical protein SWY16_16500 [Cyanobacteriota bacterium]|nr:hypothetical protein [Cyanobacteriota bacterium]